MNLSDKMHTGGASEDDYMEGMLEDPSDFVNRLKSKTSGTSEDLIKTLGISKCQIGDLLMSDEEYYSKDKNEPIGDGDEDEEDDEELDDFVSDNLDDLPAVPQSQTDSEDSPPIIRPNKQKSKEVGEGSEDTGDEKSYGRKYSKAQVIIACIAAFIFIVWFMFSMLKGSSDEDTAPVNNQQTSSRPEEPHPSNNQPPVVQEKIVYQPIEPPKFYPEYVDIPEQFYSDRMVVSKFTTMQDNTIAFFFMGIPDNFKQKVVFPVNATTYNQVANGSVIHIDYRIETHNGSDYLLDVVTNVGGI